MDIWYLTWFLRVKNQGQLSGMVLAQGVSGVPVNTLVRMQSFDSSAKAEVRFQDGLLTWLSAGGLGSSLWTSPLSLLMCGSWPPTATEGDRNRSHAVFDDLGPAVRHPSPSAVYHFQCPTDQPLI